MARSGKNPRETRGAQEEIGAERDGPPDVRRRTMLAGAGMGALALATSGVRFASSVAADPISITGPLVRDTWKGMLAFSMPGSDRYSVHQRMSTSRPGGVDSGALDALMHTYDEALPVPLFPERLNITVPGAAGLAILLNLYALRVNPLASIGPFLTPFARLRFAQKARVFQLLDSDILFPGTPLKYVVNTIPTLSAFVAFSEAGVFNPATKTLSGTPVGWQLTKYPGVSDGWDEFEGYYLGVSEATDGGRKHG